jgi:uncharacterized lipoprotein YehR (DUF1307 family)
LEVGMKKWILLVVAVLMVVSLAGCGGNNGGTDNNTKGNGNTTETQQWAAYAFGETVKPSSGGSGKIKTFTIDSKTTEDGKVREFKIDGTYLGKEPTQIVTQKTVMNLSTYETTVENVTTSLECYKVKHRVTVVRDDTGDIHPAWADTTLWIPTDNFETTASYLWIYPKATYVDSDGHTGEMSYYLTEAMQNEVSNPPAGTSVFYSPISEGDFYGYDEYAFFGLYGWGWVYFQAFAEGGGYDLEEAHVSTPTWSYNCTKVDKTIGGYTFHAWSVNWNVTAGGSTGGWAAIFSPDLALPIYSKFGGTGEGSSSSFEYTLTDLELQ